MMKYYLILLFYCIFLPSNKAQNLVKDPSFESVSFYPNNCTDLEWPLYEWNRNVNQSFFHSLLNDTTEQLILNQCSFTSMPYSIVVGYQYPRTGVSCTRLFVTDTSFGGGYVIPFGRSYIMGELTQPMNVGKKYCVEFYVNLANRDGYVNGIRLYSNLAIDAFQIKFSSSAILYNELTYYGDDYDLMLKDSSENFLRDTLGWDRIFNSYTAKGGEKYFIFGNFFNNLNTRQKLFTNVFPLPTSSDFANLSYYFIDDVSIIELPDLIISSAKDVIIQGESVQLSANIQDTEVLWYALPDTTQPIGSGTQIWVQPQQSTQYVAKTQMCRYTATDSLWIKVKVPQAPPPKPLSIVQNLSHQQFTIVYEDREALEWQLYNAAGQLIRQQSFSSTTEVNISDLAAGMYLCKILKGKQQLLTEKVMKLN